MDTTLKKCKLCGATFDSIPEIDDCICSECMEGECFACKAEKKFGGHSNLHTCKNRKERNKKLKNIKLEGGVKMGSDTLDDLIYEGLQHALKEPGKEKKMKQKCLTWEDLAELYKERTGQSAKIRPMDSIYDWAKRQDDIIEKDDCLIRKEKKMNILIENIDRKTVEEISDLLERENEKIVTKKDLDKIVPAVEAFLDRYYKMFPSRRPVEDIKRPFNEAMIDSESDLERGK